MGSFPKVWPVTLDSVPNTNKTAGLSHQEHEPGDTFVLPIYISLINSKKEDNKQSPFNQIEK